MTAGCAVTWLGHATVRVDLDGMRVLTDPLLTEHLGPLRRRGGVPSREAWGDVDVAVISHLHHDHLDLRSLRMLDRRVTVVVPAGAGPLVERAGFDRVIELTEGESTAFGPVTIEAISARHSGFRPPMGPTVRALGYLLRGSQTAYFAGDTGRFEGMASLSTPVDLALLPVGGWGPTLRAGHLDPRGAAEVLRLIRPRAAVPIHWGTFWPAGLSWLRPSRQQLPGIDFAEHAARLAPDVAVEVLDLGESVDLARLIGRGGANR